MSGDATCHTVSKAFIILTFKNTISIESYFPRSSLTAASN